VPQGAQYNVKRLIHHLGIVRALGTARRRQARAPDSATACLRERVKHRFDVERPNRLLAADFTYVSVGCSPGCEQNDDGFVLGMLEQAVCDP